MTAWVEEILSRYGQAVSLETGEGRRAARAFIQPVRERRELLPGAVTEIGWVDSIIEFDGKHWSLMDPTLAAGNSRSSLKKYIGDGKNYTVKYSY